MRDYKNIQAYQYADELAVAVYQITQSFPKDEQYGLISQLRRAAVSVAANIAEGASRNHHKDYLQFLYVSRGSLAELEYLIHLAEKLNFMKQSQSHGLVVLKDQTAKTLFGLITVVQKEVTFKFRVHSL